MMRHALDKSEEDSETEIGEESKILRQHIEQLSGNRVKGHPLNGKPENPPKRHLEQLKSHRLQMVHDAYISEAESKSPLRDRLKPMTKTHAKKEGNNTALSQAHGERRVKSIPPSGQQTEESPKVECKPMQLQTRMTEYTGPLHVIHPPTDPSSSASHHSPAKRFFRPPKKEDDQHGDKQKTSFNEKPGLSKIAQQQQELQWMHQQLSSHRPQQQGPSNPVPAASQGPPLVQATEEEPDILSPSEVLRKDLIGSKRKWGKKKRPPRVVHQQKVKLENVVAKHHSISTRKQPSDVLSGAKIADGASKFCLDEDSNFYQLLKQQDQMVFLGSGDDNDDHDAASMMDGYPTAEDSNDELTDSEHQGYSKPKGTMITSPHSSTSKLVTSSLDDVVIGDPKVKDPPKGSQKRGTLNFSSSTELPLKMPKNGSGPLDELLLSTSLEALLTDAELVEIKNYNKVYFLGENKEIKVQANPPEDKFGAEIREDSIRQQYDNESGTYRAIPGDHLDYRYETLELLGQGSFGSVYSCKDHKTKRNVAVKIVKSKERFRKQAVKEAATLNFLKTAMSDLGTSEQRRHQKPCIVELQESFDFRLHPCLVFPLYGRNLYEHLKHKNFEGLSVSFVKKVATQLLHALQFLRAHDIVHCDIKPENVLLKDERTVEVVLIDFGSSCKGSETSFTYIQSRFYRAPEVILGLPYGLEIDMWSVACILPELRTAYPAFPGENEKDQLACISEVLGQPPSELCLGCTRKNRLLKQIQPNEFHLRIVPSPSGKQRTVASKTLEDLIVARRQDAAFVDFLQQTLRWDPKDRLTPEQALKHPF